MSFNMTKGKNKLEALDSNSLFSFISFFAFHIKMTCIDFKGKPLL